jgi:hypothetical protein
LKLNQLIAERSVDRKKFTESKASLEAIIKELGIDLQKSKSQYVSSCSELQIKLDSANQRCHEVESLLEEQRNLEDPISANPDEDSIKMISSLASQLHECNMQKQQLEIQLKNVSIKSMDDFLAKNKNLMTEISQLKQQLNMAVASGKQKNEEISQLRDSIKILEDSSLAPSNKLKDEMNYNTTIIDMKNEISLMAGRLSIKDLDLSSKNTKIQELVKCISDLESRNKGTDNMEKNHVWQNASTPGHFSNVGFPFDEYKVQVENMVYMFLL